MFSIKYLTIDFIISFVCYFVIVRRQARRVTLTCTRSKVWDSLEVFFIILAIPAAFIFFIAWQVEEIFKR